MDNLEKDAIRAMKLGYGVRYGQYKADHPHTKDQELEPENIPESFTKCRNCGGLFRNDRGHRKIYCCEACGEAYRKRKQRTKKKEEG